MDPEANTPAATCAPIAGEATTTVPNSTMTDLNQQPQQPQQQQLQQLLQHPHQPEHEIISIGETSQGPPPRLHISIPPITMVAMSTPTTTTTAATTTKNNSSSTGAYLAHPLDPALHLLDGDEHYQLDGEHLVHDSGTSGTCGTSAASQSPVLGDLASGSQSARCSRRRPLHSSSSFSSLQTLEAAPSAVSNLSLAPIAGDHHRTMGHHHHHHHHRTSLGGHHGGLGAVANHNSSSSSSNNSNGNNSNGSNNNHNNNNNNNISNHHRDQPAEAEHQQHFNQHEYASRLHHSNQNTNPTDLSHLEAYFGCRSTGRSLYGNLKASRSLSVMIGNPKDPGHPHHHGHLHHHDHHQRGITSRTPSPHRRTLHHIYNHLSLISPRSHQGVSPINNSDSMSGLYHTLMDERIIHCQLSIAHKKDFAEEVRALLDVKKFVADSFILMNVTKTQVSDIIDYVLEKLVKCRCLSDEVYHEARSSIYVEAKDQLLASTMQGLYKSRIDGRLSYDNSWILATCNLSTLTKRQVAIARLPYPVNFGRYFQEVRFVIIILVPSKEKMTKSAWETGRTFATMFTDINFRRNLLRAKNQEEFKIELLTRAENLAKPSDEDSSSGVDLDDMDSLDRATTAEPNSNATAATTTTTITTTTNNNNNNNNNGTSSIDGSTGKNGARSLKKRRKDSSNGKPNEDGQDPKKNYCLAGGLTDDIRRRLKYYASDYLDGIYGHNTLYKTTATTIFLYFSVLLPCVAFGVVDTKNTNGSIDPKKTMIGQALGGLLFAIFGGQPMVVLMTTGPLCIFVKVIYQISQDLNEDFLAFYACVGLWMALFLVIFSVTNMSNLMSYCTRSTEDIFAIFTAFAFGSDGIKEAIRSFQKYYYEPECYTHGTILVSHTLDHSNKNLTATYTSAIVDLEGGQHEVATVGHELSVNHRCSRETCILFLFLMSGTLWLANSFSEFNRTPYLSMRKREIIKDYALAISVLIFSFIGTYLFVDIKLDAIEFSEFTGLRVAQMHMLSASAVGIATLLGFLLSILFYIDQNICGAMVHNSPYKLKKGDYFHLDLLVLAILNAFLSLVGMPWMHGKLPHSHLHSKAMADYEERVDEGHIHQVIVNIRETRLTGILCSLLIGLSLLAVPYPLSYIPIPVLSGVFIYTAMAEFKSNSMAERICLFFTEQAAYPPNHYIRRCPQRKIHYFTIGQLIQLLLVCFVGFYPSPYVSMAFPLVVASFVPFREKIMPWFIDSKYLDSLDSHD